MADRIDIDEKKLEQLKDLYLDKKLSLKKTSIEIGRSIGYITRVLKENNWYNYKDKNTNKKRILPTPKKGYKFVAVYKETGEQFSNYQNLGGELTRCIKKYYPNFIEPKNRYHREKIERETGFFWYEKFFYIIEVEEKEIKQCRYCNWTTVDTENKSGWFTLHIKNEHNMTIDRYVNQFPKEKSLFKTYFRRKKFKEETEANNNNYIICHICDKKMRALTNTHLKKHNMTMSQYKLKFPNQRCHSTNFINNATAHLKKANINAQNHFISKPEMNLNIFLKSIDLSIDKNNRKLLNGIEIDAIDHDRKIGIEFNGCKYHTEIFNGKGRLNHITKTRLMNEKGYGLIHIFEDEWELRNDIVKSKLKHIFGINTNSEIIHARKCTIKEIDSKTKNDFLNLNHIQGKDKAKIKIGAFFNEQLIAVMTFDNNRNMNGKNNLKSVYELRRFCTSINYIISGIAHRMIKYFINNYTCSKIITFADVRWTINKDDNLYTKLNFNMVKQMGPEYSYYNNKIDRLKRFHKFGFGKSSLKKKYPNTYDIKKTEWQMMQELGFDRIWDCGKFRYELDF